MKAYLLKSDVLDYVFLKISSKIEMLLKPDYFKSIPSVICLNLVLLINSNDSCAQDCKQSFFLCSMIK